METIYKEQSIKSGIYKIYNKLNGRIYIGSAKEFKERYKGHISSLRNNKHSNKFLQNDFNKCGEENFVFEVVEVVVGTKLDRTKREKELIAIYHDGCKNCYNQQKNPESVDRSCYSKNPEETSQKLSAAGKKRYSNPEERKRHSELLKGIPKPPRSKEYCEAMSKAKTGIIHSDETKQKMSDSHKIPKNIQKLKETYEKHREHIIEKQSDAVSKKHLIQNVLTGETIEIINLNKFCKENNMHSSGFSNILRKGKGQYKGYVYLGSFSKE